MAKTKTLKIAVDFDGTVVEHQFPGVGKDVPYAVTVLQELVAAGHKLIIFTMRSGEYLDDAVQWYKDRGIELFGINRDPEQDTWTSSPKAYAHIFIDDAALGVPLIYVPGKRPYVDWMRVRERLVNEHNLILGVDSPTE